MDKKKIGYHKKTIDIGKKKLIPDVPYPKWMIKDKSKDED